MDSAARVPAVWRLRSATVVVSATLPAPNVSLSANPAQIAQGGTSTLSWSATNASTCTASGGWSGAKAISGSQTTSALSQSATFTLACTGAGGTTTRSVRVTVTPATPPPTVTLTAAPSAVVQGGSSTISWTTANATSCVASGDWSGSRGLSGSQSTGVLNTVRTYSYTLSCSGAGGTTSRTATVVVSALATATDDRDRGHAEPGAAGRDGDAQLVVGQCNLLQRLGGLVGQQAIVRFTGDRGLVADDNIRPELQRRWRHGLAVDYRDGHRIADSGGVSAEGISGS